ncbi:MAG: hypothetical protein P8R54_07195 [Myxococcota bacterium]|nr:hypothetical protein [Myxococcota bacterium]
MKNAIRRRSMLMAKSRKPRNDEEHTRFAQSQLGFEYLSVHDDGMAELELIGTDGSVLYREALVKKD